MTVFEFLDITGTIAFAISGAMVAMRKKFDTFGVLIIAFATSVGGGSLRDILIDRQPIFWMGDMKYIYCILAGLLIAILFRKKLKYLSKSLFLFDTIGLGLYTIVGTEIGLNANFHPLICVLLGTISASFGGVLRDILCSKIPLIFKREIYATASILGSVTLIILTHFNVNTNIKYIGTALIVIIIRLIAVRFKLSLPTFYTSK